MPDSSIGYEWSWCLASEKEVRISQGWEIIEEPIGKCNIFGTPMEKYIMRRSNARHIDVQR